MAQILQVFQILKTLCKIESYTTEVQFQDKRDVFLSWSYFQHSLFILIQNSYSIAFHLVEGAFQFSIQPIAISSTIFLLNQQLQVSISNYSECGLLFYCVYFRLFIDQMAETEQKQKYLEETGEKPQDRDDENDQDSLSHAYMTDEVDSEDLDLESTYLNRLRIQRKRIEELSLSLTISKEKYEEEVSLRKGLEAELEKFQSGKISSYRIEEIHIQMTTVQEENQRLTTQSQQLKRDIVDIRAQCQAKLARMATEVNNQRRKDLAKIEALQEQLSEKEDEVENLQKQLKYKERQLNQSNNHSSSKVSKLKEQYEERLKFEQRKVEKFQQQKVKSSNGQDIETQFSFAIKEVERLKDQNSKMVKYIEERERELLHQVEKYKAKLSALKKDLRAKQKDYDDLKASHVKFEREKKDQASEREQLKVQVTKITEEYQTVLARKENDSYVEKRNMKATIDEQGKAIGELMATRQKYLARIRQLEAILKRNDDAKHHRKMLLKDELRQIEKLQKVIDRIVE